MEVLANCEPKRVFHFFEWLSSVPHGSGNTKAVSDLCVSFARERGIRCEQDEWNNVILYQPATPGYEQAPTVILQGHLDMVCAKEPDDPTDLRVTPIKLETDGKYVWAKNTSLGGDDLIACAMALAILDDDTLPHPALEVLLTADEETGMYGAAGLDPSLISGRILLNLDSEEEGVLTVGCAGGARLNCSLPMRREPVPAGSCGSCGVRVRINGLKSGHSGEDIDKERGSSHLLTARLLHEAAKRFPIRLTAFYGGEFDNAIPAQTIVELVLPASSADEFAAYAAEFGTVYQKELASSDPGVTVTVERIAAADTAVTAEDSAKAFAMLIMFPSGIQHMSMDIPGLVETSLNLGILRLEEDRLDFSFLVRSSLESRKDFLIERVRQIVSVMGGTTEEHSRYPGWAYARVSPLRDLILEVYREQTGREGVVSATHGGLECGILLDKLPGLDCVSVGPALRDIHSVRETLDAASVERLYALVCEVLRRIRA